MKKRKILIVEDDKHSLKIARDALAAAGYEIAEAANGRAGLEAAAREVPDLVLLDCMLPLMDGFEVCRRLREDERTKYVPVIFLTAMGEAADRMKCFRSGADDYLPKPFSPVELVARVDALFNRLQKLVDLNLLTGLPGTTSIETELKGRIEKEDVFATCHIDVDNFKAFNEKYGYEAGDGFLMFTSNCLREAARMKGKGHDYLGHMGSDDFIYICPHEVVEPFCNAVIDAFERGKGVFLDKEDRSRGYIPQLSRKGQPLNVPIPSLSIAVVKRKVSHMGEIARIAAELQTFAISMPGSKFVVDRREAQETPPPLPERMEVADEVEEAEEEFSEGSQTLEMSADEYDYGLQAAFLVMTFRCNLQCDHCFVWAHSGNAATMEADDIVRLLRQCREIETLKWIFFTGGEPFLYYPSLLKGVEEAKKLGFKVGVVTNGYWAVSERDARGTILPLVQAGMNHMSICEDHLRSAGEMGRFAAQARETLENLHVATGSACCAWANPCASFHHGDGGEEAPIFRGRGAVSLTETRAKRSWVEFEKCPYENLSRLRRVFIDPSGAVQICQGIVIGNSREMPLREMIQNFDVRIHPIISVLGRGGPAALVAEYSLPLRGGYADACHICYAARSYMRPRFPHFLGPGQVYGMRSAE